MYIEKPSRHHPNQEVKVNTTSNKAFCHENIHWYHALRKAHHFCGIPSIIQKSQSNHEKETNPKNEGFLQNMWSGPSQKKDRSLLHKKMTKRPGSVMYFCNPGTQESQARKLRPKVRPVQGQTGLHNETLSQKKKNSIEVLKFPNQLFQNSGY
jgi:hypothetical protein